MLCCQRVGDLESMAAAKDVLKNVFNKTKNQTEKKFKSLFITKILAASLYAEGTNILRTSLHRFNNLILNMV